MASILGTTNEKKMELMEKFNKKNVKREKYNRKYTERDIIT